MDAQGAPRHSTVTSGIPQAAPHKHGALGTLVPYLLGIAVVFAAAVVLSIVLDLGVYYWLITLLGALVITTLLSSTAVPDIQSKRQG